MSVRLNVVLSDDLNSEIDKAVAESESTKADILRKALQLYLAARHGSRRGLKVGLVEPKTEKMQTEIIGLRGVREPPRVSSSTDLNSPPPNHKFSLSVKREETVGERRPAIQGRRAVCGPDRIRRSDRMALLRHPDVRACDAR